MTYTEALAYFDSFINYERVHSDSVREVKLERMRQLCTQLGDPQRSFRSILVAGTNGKGSICSMLYSMLRQSSFTVGLYTSPHLMDIRERIRICKGSRDALWNDSRADDGSDWISQEEFVSALESLRPVLENMRADSPYGAPTYFEVLTAIAFYAFRRRGVEIAVIEVGLGGRLDATNVVDQAVSVFAPINLDHEAVLGEAITDIAYEKAAVIKSGHTVVCSPQAEAVQAVIDAAADGFGAKVLRYGRDFTAEIKSHQLDRICLDVIGTRTCYSDLELFLCGRYQAENLAVAVAALEAVADRGIPHSMVEVGAERVLWPGRFEIVHEGPTVMLDGAHNEHGIKHLAVTLQELLPESKIHFLVGVSSDKNIKQLGKTLGSLAASVTCTASRHPRALDPEELARQFEPHCTDIHVMSDICDAYTYLLNTVAPEDCIVVTGSIFLVGELRQALYQAGTRSARTEALI